jgi:hypothetical protein
VITVDKALLELVPGTRWVLKGNSYSGLNWLDIDIDKPSEEQIQAKIAELQAAEPMRLLRIERDRLIQQTDWWVLPDRTATPAQLEYRQALRDLPANSTPALDENGNLTGVEWPVYSEEA